MSSAQAMWTTWDVSFLRANVFSFLIDAYNHAHFFFFPTVASESRLRKGHKCIVYEDRLCGGKVQVITVYSFFFSRLPKYRIPFWLHGQIEPRYYLRWGFPREARNNKFHCPLLTLHLGECQHFLAIWKTSPEPSGTPLISKLYLVLYRSHCVIPESFCLGLVCKSPDIFYDSILLPEFHIVVYDGLECQFHFFKRLIHETRRCF